MLATLRREMIDCTVTLHGALCGIYGGEELLVTRVQCTVPRHFQVINRIFGTLVTARTAYSAVLSATPIGLSGVSLSVQL